MKITKLKTQLVNLPLDKPISTAIHSMVSVGCVCVSLETDKGLVGESYIFSLNAVRLKAFDEMVKGLAYFVIDQDPHYVSAIWANIWKEINPSGHKGVTVSALSALDTACWDLIGKSADKPLHHVFGACRDRIKTYASSGLWLSQSIDELQTQASQFVKDGFHGMKIRAGSKNIQDDIERVKAVRDAVGPEIELMVDLNQAHDTKKAIRLGHQLQQFNLIWVEEPVPAYDLKGHARVTNALTTPIASGETEYTRFGMQSMIEQQACDILMPDLQRAGGLSEMLKIAHLASAHNMSISTHIFTEHSLCIAGSANNCISVEHMPWYSRLFNESMEIDQGDILIPNRPGIGFTFNQDNLKQYALL